MRILFLLFAILPIIEIALLVKVGGIIGGWNTIAIVILTAFLGSYLVRREGLQTLQTAQDKMQRNELPGNEIVQGLMLVVAGVLLVTPGFMTDILGLLFVFPGSRHVIASHLTKHMKARVVTSAGFGGQSPFDQPQSPFTQQPRDENGDVYEGQYTNKTDNDENNRLR
ncbi:FxsA family protein [Salinimonas marina]|uniref:FxsA family protein n=1 Tax=Salinimonas marina TaxID=2785918 RepID=A0A7S9DX69_9ALTE|nr:FxsA family protein [Salinimonas marina]QPG05543.1 FxsA family protein [Salinimonas marina]